MDKQRTHARNMRKSMTDAERLLWRSLRDRRFAHCKFRRQHPIGPYITDFACIAQKLVIELDGGQHAKQQAYDARRTRYLEEYGYRVIRFWDNEVLGNIEGVLASILQALEPPHPCPLPGGARENEEE